MCAASDYLTGLLRQNPGMVDELVDSLAVDSMPILAWLNDHMADLIHGAEDIGPIVHSFKQAQHLRVGIRDLIGRDSMQVKQGALSNIVQVCLTTVTDHFHRRLVAKYGRPMFDEIETRASQMVILALGKLGGQEPSYHSDLDVIFLYEGDGETVHRNREKQTSNQHFFGELAANITKFISHAGAQGRLFEMDNRLRPTGKNGPLAVSFDEFARYFESGPGQFWERMALCKARVVYGDRNAAQSVMKLVQKVMSPGDWSEGLAGKVLQMRAKMEKGISEHNIKRGIGGTVDVEFIVQFLQLQHASNYPAIREQGTHEGLVALIDANVLDAANGNKLADSYLILRQVESGIRLMNRTGLLELPTEESSLKRLAYVLQFENVKKMSQMIEEARKTIRECFLEIVR